MATIIIEEHDQMMAKTFFEEIVNNSYTDSDKDFLKSLRISDNEFKYSDILAFYLEGVHIDYFIKC